jgi:hypothetical protein
MPETIAVELATPAAPLGIAWRPEALRALGDAGADAERPWSLEGEVDWEGTAMLRIVSAAFEDGSLLGVAAFRPEGVQGHGDEAVSAILVREGGEPEPLRSALVSTEYGPDGLPRRIGLELRGDPETAPVRVAADRRGEVRTAGDGARQVAAMEFRMEGTRGAGLCEIVRH